VGVDEKYKSLSRILKSLGKVIVAYSGGVDSTFLLKAAVDTLGAENVLACIGVSESLAQSQHQRALECAELIGATLEEVKVHEVSDERYAANEADRCFHCKSHLYQILTDLAKQRGFDNVICGSNLDDTGDYRPGNRAAEVFGVRAPLVEAQMTKANIRKMSRRMNLPTADIPASPCLASRVAYGLQITGERLKQVEEAEEFLRSLGFVEFRVRHHGEIARIEVHPEDFGRLTEEPTRSRVVEKLKSLGFSYVTIDLQGFRSGSLNEPLSEQDKAENL